MKKKNSPTPQWADQAPEPAIIAALNLAGPKPLDSASQDDKRNWSDRFADGCAFAIADEFRKHDQLKSKRILPRELGSSTEPLTPLGAGTKKRIDVTVADALLGLEIGVSMKGYNFKDGEANNYDKNLTGRLYELGDEMRLVHEHLPHAFMVAILFLPLGSTVDKKSAKSASSFARTVVKLRERTGRLDPALHAHASRCDLGYVALYAVDEGADPCPQGVCRLMNTNVKPPRRGRPRIEDTLSISEAVTEMVRKATHSAEEEWGDAEQDPPESKNATGEKS